ncbi:MAG: LD-carboxypeptidase [Lachnospiraceae bacterium]|nr:LD-carboxypeptidase [Lachnospiraceae bacterium]
MRYPTFIGDHCTIALVAPSFGVTIEPYRSQFEEARKRFRNLGYDLRIGPNVFKDDGIGISTDPVDCAREVTTALTSERNDAVISVGGGELMDEILPYVDFEKIGKSDPKWFMGYSDNTNITYLLATLCDQASVYGPCFPAFGMEPWDRCLTDAVLLLRGEKLRMTGYEKYEKESLRDEEHPLSPYNLTEDSSYVIFDKKGRKLGDGESVSMSGRLMGGCIDCLRNLPGTAFDAQAEFNHRYRKDGVIWFLEACDLNVFDMRRALWSLKEAGWFETAKGFLIGRSPNMDTIMNLDAEEAVMGMIGDMGVPVVMGVDIGHMPPRTPVISGAFGNVTASSHQWEVSFR